MTYYHFKSCLDQPCPHSNLRKCVWDEPFPGRLKSYKRETKLFEFLQDINREELKIRQKDVNLQWLGNNGFLAMALMQWFLLPRLPMFTDKATIFLGDGLYWKISARCQGLVRQRKCSISLTNLYIICTTGNNSK